MGRCFVGVVVRHVDDHADNGIGDKHNPNKVVDGAAFNGAAFTDTRAAFIDRIDPFQHPLPAPLPLPNPHIQPIVVVALPLHQYARVPKYGVRLAQGFDGSVKSSQVQR